MLLMLNKNHWGHASGWNFLRKAWRYRGKESPGTNPDSGRMLMRAEVNGHEGRQGTLHFLVQVWILPWRQRGRLSLKVSGAPGWLSQLSIWLWLRSWSHCSWVWVPHRGEFDPRFRWTWAPLRWAPFLFLSLSLSLCSLWDSFPLCPLLTCSLSP